MQNDNLPEPLGLLIMHVNGCSNQISSFITKCCHYHGPLYSNRYDLTNI